MYVISISYRISESNTLPTVVLAQGVRDFDFVQKISESNTFPTVVLAQDVRDFDFLQNIRV